MRNLPDREKKTRYLEFTLRLAASGAERLWLSAKRTQKESGEAEPRRWVDTGLHGKAEPYRTDAAKPHLTG